MTQAIGKPTLTKNGVMFTVTTTDFIKHDCIISKDALAALSSHQSGEFGPLEIFRANEARIYGVARRLITARVAGTPLRLEPRSFH